MNNIRNFSIIAHIDHGKSTLADRMLEVTGTIEKRKMKAQVLDKMELERERGITIKMAPVTMDYQKDGIKYKLNLIDTPGHIDFSYEVSRALKAVEGAILLVDATQGVQAQTFTTLDMAKKIGLKIIPVLSKIDSPIARVDDVIEEIIEVTGCEKNDVICTSGKTGEGVTLLIDSIIDKVPPPKQKPEEDLRALVFDFEYSNHRGVVVYTRIVEGEVKKGSSLSFKIAGKSFVASEVGIFRPEETPTDLLSNGQIGYIVTGIKEPGIARVGDTIVLSNKNTDALPGYQDPKPVIWASVFPESQDDFTVLRQSLERLKLSDGSLSFEEESSGVLGRGFRCGFLGMLHLEIITERLRREFNIDLVVTTPSITYEVTDKKNNTKLVYSPALFPPYGEISSIRERWTSIRLITPAEYIDSLIQILYDHEGSIVDTHLFGDGRTEFTILMPLRELMRNFFDDIKRVSSGYASLSYEINDEWSLADVVLLEVLVAEDVIPAFSRVVSRRRAEEEAKKIVEKLFTLLPKQLTKTKIQAMAQGRIMSSKTISAMKKDVTDYLYGGDITRKMKLREKQKKGKKKMQEFAKANIPQEVFMKVMRDSN
ncbi:elongation factor 4 [Candidatus Campbellbacteria bacterium CG22_combo_CG10-13_8_21_14_all_36_13]|uniref:Elongation factor 4 n=1 Tax=Candidatus Campbellbacteria bacterium CG22_combo_CG10-13_8_21_14_all_36_13 TaxID=1974529 RepID=A0A2H0DY16_9BACT|nr:MAG: elongation factor 4 [Candidatus Campbellbacteria bacterium CG22_combo_CG10-13_8_21_14_all_36_13]